jgi:hypothetical protein
MHRPVGSAYLTELAGATQRIDDPDALGPQTPLVIGCFFREHRVVRSRLGQPVEFEKSVSGTLNFLTPAVRDAGSKQIAALIDPIRTG